MSDNSNSQLILVTGATGKQGGAALKHLLDKGFRVRALVRDPQKPEAQALAERGVELAQGNLNEAASVEQALNGVYGVFSVQGLREGIPAEVQQGVALAQAAKKAGVQHFVYSSVGSAHKETGIPHFDSKFSIEEEVRRLDLPYTIVRPVFFMDNWEWSRQAILGGTLAQPLTPDTRLQQVATEDIGGVAALAFAKPSEWLGRAVDLAGDELTLTELAAVFSRVIGRPVQYQQIPIDQFRQRAGDEDTIMYQWFQDVGYSADIPALRAEYPQLLTVEQYLRSRGWGEQK